MSESTRRLTSVGVTAVTCPMGRVLCCAADREWCTVTHGAGHSGYDGYCGKGKLLLYIDCILSGQGQAHCHCGD